VQICGVLKSWGIPKPMVFNSHGRMTGWFAGTSGTRQGKHSAGGGTASVGGISGHWAATSNTWRGVVKYHSRHMCAYNLSICIYILYLCMYIYIYTCKHMLSICVYLCPSIMNIYIYLYTRICARKYNIDRLDWIGLDWIRLYEIDQIRSDWI
jgi:hypothetical protein